MGFASLGPRHDRAAELQRRSDPAALHIVTGASTDRTSTQKDHVDFSFGQQS